jgi:hypothetical protein
MFIPDPDFLPIPDTGSWIPDPKTSTKERDEKFFFHTLFCSHKFYKLKNYSIFEMLKKKRKNNKIFTQKFVTKLLKIWIWDPGSKIRFKKAPDPGPGVKKSTGSRIPDPDPQHWIQAEFGSLVSDVLFREGMAKSQDMIM